MNERLQNNVELESQEQITEHNYQMLTGDMQKLLNEESLGGNAGSVEINGRHIPCAAANGYARQIDGKIIAFGNPQNIPGGVKQTANLFTLRVTLGDISTDGKLSRRIVGFSSTHTFSAEGTQALQDAIDRFNVDSER